MHISQTAPPRPVVRAVDPPTPLGFRILGPLSIASGTSAVVLAPSKPTSLLAALLLRPNEMVSIAALQDAVWGDERPLAAKAALQTCAMRLRQLFGRHGVAENVIETVPGGYRILASAESLDLVRFRVLMRESRSATDRESELYGLEAALSLWQGPLLANVPSETLHRDLVPRIVEERLRAIERVSDLRISSGRSRAALVDLWEAARTYPAHERFSEQLIEALYRTGRQAEALAECRRIKDYLNEELGVDPGPALRGLEMAILRGETLPDVDESPIAGNGGDRRPATPEPDDRVRTVASPREFVGRDVVSRAIADRLAAGTSLIVLSGPPGIGKTALARHVAGLVVDAFPGGQVLVAMRQPDGEPCPPADLAAHIDALDVPSRQTLTTRGLWLLDDVADVEQALRMLPLLGSGNSVVITSRASLAGLIARHGGWLHRLDVLDPAESATLLGAVLGADRVAAEPQASREIADLCDHLPLALRIIATRLLTRPKMTLTEAASWLDDDRLSRLALPGDPGMSVTGRFDAAMRHLSAPLAEAFLRLGTAEAPDLTISESARLLEVAPDAAEVVLDQLVDASLLDEGPGGYWMHDLLKLYARSTADRRLSPPHSKGFPQ